MGTNLILLLGVESLVLLGAVPICFLKSSSTLVVFRLLKGTKDSFGAKLSTFSISFWANSSRSLSSFLLTISLLAVEETLGMIP